MLRKSPRKRDKKTKEWETYTETSLRAGQPQYCELQKGPEREEESIGENVGSTSDGLPSNLSGLGDPEQRLNLSVPHCPYPKNVNSILLIRLLRIQISPCQSCYLLHSQ